MALGTILSAFKGFPYGTEDAVLLVPGGATPGMGLIAGMSGRTLNGVSASSTFLNPGEEGEWTVAQGDATTNGNDDKILKVWTKVMADGDAGWEFPYQGDKLPRAGFILAIPGIDPTTPGFISAIQKSTSDTPNHTTPSLTMPATDGIYLQILTDHLVTDGTLPSGFAHVGSLRQPGKSGVTFEAKIGVAFKLFASSGATGAQTFTDNQVGGDDYVGISLGIPEGLAAQILTGLEILRVPIRFGIGKMRGDGTLTAGEEALADRRSRVFPVWKISPRNVQNAGAPEDHYIALSHWTPDSEVATTPAEARLEEGFEISESLIEGAGGQNGRIGGRGTPSAGDLVILNPDRLRSTGDRALVEFLDKSKYRFNGAEAELRIAGYDRHGTLIPWSSAARVWKGLMRSIGGTHDRLTIRFADAAELARRRRVQQRVFAGTGGIEGGADLKGKPMPFLVGEKRGGKPTWVSNETCVIAGDALGNDLEEFIELATRAQPYDTSQYDVTSADGVCYVTMRTAFERDQVTFWAKGPAAAGATGSSIARYLGVDLGPYSSADWNPTAEAIFALEMAGQAGLFMPTEENWTLAEALDRLVQFPLGHWGFDRGLFEAGIIDPSTNETADHVVYTEDIDEIEFLHDEPELWWFRLGYGENSVPMSRDQIAAAAFVTDHGDFALQRWRVTERRDEGILQLEPGAPEPDVVGSPLTEEAEAALLADRIWNVLSRTWQPLRILVNRKALAWRKRDLVTVYHDDFPQLSGGQNFRVLGLRKRLGQVEAHLLRTVDPSYWLLDDDTPLLAEEGHVWEF